MARRITPKTKSRAWWGQHRWSIAHMSGGSRTASVEHAGSLPSCVHPHFPSPLGRRLQLSTQSIRGVAAPLSRRNCAGGICGTRCRRARALSRTPGVTLVQSPAFAVIGERAGADQFDRTAMYLFAKTIVAGTPIKLFNQGNMQRDHSASRSGVWQVSTQS